jgi:TolA-binding protein
MSFDEEMLDPSSSTSPASKESDLSFSGLKEHVKKVMIPLLIKIFELKLAAQQAKTPPSRLQKKSDQPPEAIQEQLLKLSEDLKSLQLWCQSCQNQIQKALCETEEKKDTPPPSMEGMKVEESKGKSKLTEFLQKIFS